MCKLKDYFESKRAEAEKLYQQELDRLANVDIDEVKIPKEITVEDRATHSRLHPDGDDQYDENRDNNL
jgi:hypothetical protein